METPPKVELRDPRSGIERFLGRSGSLLVLLATLVVTMLADINGKLWETAPAILFFSGLAFSLCLLFHFASLHWAIIGVDSAGLTIEREKEVVRIPWSAVVRLDWSNWGNLTLWTEDGRRLLPVEAKDYRQRLGFYRKLRRYVPDERQRNRLQFCQQRIAWRLTRSRQEAGRTPNPNEFRMTRSLHDRHWFWIAPLTLIDGGAIVAATGRWDMALSAVFAVVVMLVFTRFLIPPTGEVRPKRSVANWWLPITIGVINVGGMIFLGTIVAIQSGNSEIAQWGEDVLFVLGFGGILVLFATLMAAIWLQARYLPANQAAELWDKLDAELFGNDANETTPTAPAHKAP